MNKIAGGLARFLFGLLILVLVGYNTWETARLRAEVEAMKREGAHTVPTGKTAPDVRSLALLSKSRRHAEQAQVFLRTKRYDDARREIALAAETARKVSVNAQAESRDALTSLRNTVRALSEQAGGLFEEGKSGGAARRRPATAAGKESEKDP